MIATIATLLMTNAHMGPRASAWAARGVVFGLALLALYLAYSWAWDRGRGHERARWEAAAAKIEAADAKADAAGTVTAAETKGQFDATNKAAQDAARDSSDPLRDGIGELRRQGGGKGR